MPSGCLIHTPKAFALNHLRKSNISVTYRKHRRGIFRVIEMSGTVAEPTTFGERLRAAREAAGLTQAELADTAGIHRVDVNRYERGKFEPSLSVAFRLADALGVRVDDLRGEKNEGE